MARAPELGRTDPVRGQADRGCDLCRNTGDALRVRENASAVRGHVGDRDLRADRCVALVVIAIARRNDCCGRLERGVDVPNGSVLRAVLGADRSRVRLRLAGLVMVAHLLPEVPAARDAGYLFPGHL